MAGLNGFGYGTRQQISWLSGIFVAVAVAVGKAVRVGVAVRVTVREGVAVTVNVMVITGVFVGVTVLVIVGLRHMIMPLAVTLLDTMSPLNSFSPEALPESVSDAEDAATSKTHVNDAPAEGARYVIAAKGCDTRDTAAVSLGASSDGMTFSTPTLPLL